MYSPPIRNKISTTAISFVWWVRSYIPPITGPTKRFEMLIAARVKPYNHLSEWRDSM